MIWYSGLAPLALLALLGAGAPAQSTSASPPPPSASPAPSPVPPTPAAAPAPTPAAATPPLPALTPGPALPTPLVPPASAEPALTPSPLPTFGYRFVPRPAASPDPTAPQIIEVDLNSGKLRDRIAIRVLTNEVVTRVENHTNGRADAIPQTGPGEFIAVSKLPKIPFIARGMRINLEFVAYAADGRKTSVKVPVQLG